MGIRTPFSPLGVNPWVIYFEFNAADAVVNNVWTDRVRGLKMTLYNMSQGDGLLTTEKTDGTSYISGNLVIPQYIEFKIEVDGNFTLSNSRTNIIYDSSIGEVSENYSGFVAGINADGTWFSNNKINGNAQFHYTHNPSSFLLPTEARGTIGIKSEKVMNGIGYRLFSTFNAQSYAFTDEFQSSKFGTYFNAQTFLFRAWYSSDWGFCLGSIKSFKLFVRGAHK